MAYTADDVLTDAKLRSNYPTSGGLLSDSDIIRLANDELIGILAGKLMAAVQGHNAIEVSIPIVVGQSRYSLPSRATGGKIRYCALSDSQGNRSEVRVGRPERFVTTRNLDVTGTPTDCWFEGGRIVLYPTPADATFSLKVGVYFRPSRLQLQANGAIVDDTAEVGATEITCRALPSYLNQAVSIDIVRASPPFNIIAYSLPIEVALTGDTLLTLDGVTLEDYGVEFGDWITLPEESVIPQMPAEIHPLLAARTAKRILQARGDLGNLEAVLGDIKDLESQLYEYLTNRDEGQVDTLSPNRLWNDLASGRWTSLGSF